MRFKNLMLTMQGLLFWSIVPPTMLYGKLVAFNIFDIAIDKSERWMFRGIIFFSYVVIAVRDFIVYYEPTHEALRLVLYKFTINSIAFSMLSDVEISVYLPVIVSMIDKAIVVFCAGAYLLFMLVLLGLYWGVRYLLIRVGYKRRLGGSTKQEVR